MSSPHLKKLEAYTAANQECARIVLTDPKRYGSEESLMVMWGRAVVATGSDRTADEKELPVWEAA